MAIMQNEDYAFTEENGHTVDGVEHFDFEALDSVEARIKEALSRGESVTLMVRELVEMEVSERVTEAIAAVIALIADAERPRLAADHIAWVTGMRMRQGASINALAKKHGMSKEAFSQAALRLADYLKLKPSRAMRSEVAKAVMRRAHFKRNKT